MTTQSSILPVALAFMAAVLWGIWWIPIRYLEGLGMTGAWGSVAMNVGGSATALAVMVVMRVQFRISRRAAVGAMLVGVAVTCYSVAITLSEVVRVILLFYLAPAWSKMIEWAFLRLPWAWTSGVAVVVSLVGAYFVLGGEVSLVGMNLGDLLAILAGIAWAAGATLIFTAGAAHPLNLSLITAIVAVVLGLAFILLGGESGLSGELTPKGSGIGVLAGALFVLPLLLLTLWSARHLTPAVISFLMTAEILSGVISGTLLLDEPFGTMQAVGAVMVLFAAAIEVVPWMVRKPA